MLIKIAITGGVASGKTTVCQFFKELGAFVVNADAIVHDLINTDLGQKLLLQFGSDILENDAISRRKLAQKTFSDPDQLKKLEELVHPVVLQKIEELYQEANRGAFTAFVVEIPLLYEIGAEKFYDVVIAVLADPATAKQRFKQAEYYEERMSRQITPHQKAKRANYTIQNNGSLEELRSEVSRLNRIIHKKQ
jgi:dephospho-CoA kinase